MVDPEEGAVLIAGQRRVELAAAVGGLALHYSDFKNAIR
jgi:hypothetical protein